MGNGHQPPAPEAQLGDSEKCPIHRLPARQWRCPAQPGLTDGLPQTHPRPAYAPGRPAHSLLPLLELGYRISPQSHLKLEQSLIFWLTSSVKNLLQVPGTSPVQEQTKPQVSEDLY